MPQPERKVQTRRLSLIRPSAIIRTKNRIGACCSICGAEDALHELRIESLVILRSFPFLPLRSSRCVLTVSYLLVHW